MADAPSARKSKAADPAQARNRRRMLLAALLAGAAYVSVMHPNEVERYTRGAATLSTGFGMSLPSLGNLGFSSSNVPTPKAPLNVGGAGGAAISAVATGSTNAGVGNTEARPAIDRQAFWAKLEAPAAGESDFAVRIEIIDADGKRERVWVHDLARQGPVVMGVIADGSQSSRFTPGARVQFQAASVVTWSFKSNGTTITGGVTS